MLLQNICQARKTYAVSSRGMSQADDFWGWEAGWFLLWIPYTTRWQLDRDWGWWPFPPHLLSTWAGMTEILEVFIGHLSPQEYLFSLYWLCGFSSNRKCLFKYHSTKNFELPINNIRIYYKNKRHSLKSPSERLCSILGPISGCCGTSPLKFLGALLLNKIL